MDWATAQKALDLSQKFIASAAIIIGALWAYYRFIRFRTFKPRLEFNFEWSRSDIDDSHALAIFTLKMANRGQTKVELQREKNPRCFLKYALVPENDSDVPMALLTVPSNRLEHLDAAFVLHKWIEPGETIDDVKVLKVNKTRLLAVQFELAVFGLHKWSASTAFPLVGGPEIESFKSEDEQDDYEEPEALKEALKNARVRIQRASDNEPVSESNRVIFQSILGKIETLLSESRGTSSFESQANQLVREAEEVLKAAQ